LRRVELTPGRVRALAFGAPLALAIIAWGGVNYVSLAAKDSFGVEHGVGSSQVDVQVGNGDLTLVGSARGPVGVRGVVDYSLVRPVAHWATAGDETTFVGPNCFWLGGCTTNLTVSVRPAEEMDASTGSGDVDARSLTGPVDLYDGSGNVSITHLSGRLLLSDSSGNIMGTALSAGNVRATDGSGNINLVFTRPPRDLRVDDASGNISVALPSGYAYKVSTDSRSGSSAVGPAVLRDSDSPNVIDLNDGSGNIAVSSSGPQG
jgi:Putative adhesin